MIYAASPELANILADTYTLIISLAIIPDLFQSSIIVPILKKATLDPNTLLLGRISLITYAYWEFFTYWDLLLGTGINQPN